MPTAVNVASAAFRIAPGYASIYRPRGNVVRCLYRSEHHPHRAINPIAGHLQLGAE